MSTRWYREKKHEHYYKQAKKVGYRARSAFKLEQIQKKFNIIRDGDSVIDLGAAPGGWSQIVKELIGKNGKVVGIDLLSIKPLDGVIFLQGDMTEDSSVDRLRESLGLDVVDVVVSDMSPEISGNYSMDQAKSVYLCEKAFETCLKFLKKDGNFVCKIFEGEDFNCFLEKLKPHFKMIKIFHPEASRKTSSEAYIICKHRR